MAHHQRGERCKEKFSRAIIFALRQHLIYRRYIELHEAHGGLHSEFRRRGVHDLIDLDAELPANYPEFEMKVSNEVRTDRLQWGYQVLSTSRQGSIPRHATPCVTPTRLNLAEIPTRPPATTRRQSNKGETGLTQPSPHAAHVMQTRRTSENRIRSARSGLLQLDRPDRGRALRL